MFDFDKKNNRANTGSLKWEKYRNKDILPMWVADMEFDSAPEINQAIIERVQQGTLGYTLATESVVASVGDALKRDFNWEIQPEWLVWLPGVVPGLAACCRAFGQPGDAVMTSSPIYHHFLHVAEIADRRHLDVPLKCVDGHWSFDLEAMRAAVTDETFLLNLCSPHNPVGRVYSKQELRDVVAFAKEHNLIVVSDEIHCGLVLDKDLEHVPTAVAAPEYADHIITLMSPSKTFNTAGVNASYAVVPNEKLRKALIKSCASVVPMVPTLCYTAAEAAYRHGEPWRLALIEHLRENYRLIESAVARWDKVALTPLQATYLAWLDVSALGLDNPQAFFEDAGVGLSGGAEFGDGRFLRLNFACQREMLEVALSRMDQAIQGLSAAA